MLLVLIVVLILLLAVALFALQNAEAVVVRFWPWQFQASVAVLTLGAMTVGALMAALVTMTARLTRWTRRRAEPSEMAPSPRPAGGPTPPPETP